MTTESTQAPVTFHPGPILLLGAPGVGKGTQAKALMAAHAIPQISTGDLLRQNRADRTELGLLAERMMQEGKLVPDYLVQQMVNDRLSHPDTKSGFILDGFPRTIPQAQWLDQLLALPRQEFVWEDAGEKPGTFLPVVAISITVDTTQLLQRITGRRISPAGRIYNIYSNPPLIPGLCDIDGSPLTQRTDDTESVFEERMRSFAEQTAPVVDHYRAQGRFAQIDGDQPVETVTAAIESALRRLRGAS